MASIGKLSGSVISAANENTLALFNVKVDFSLIRCDPSKEYVPVGLALTDARRKEAEDGLLHATACKLGFLFHEMLPDTPKIIKAYGIRVSEILSRPDISPAGTENDGPFQAFVGADCTSIWAAATCGPESISVLLLACMLARAWDAKVATSIWVELVEERRRQLEAQMRDNKIVHPHSLAAARETFGRAELAEWDASARSWLRRADLFMAFNHTQFRLVVDNLAIPYASTGSTFEKVTMAWIRSMDVVEKLLGNLPQQACDRSVLLAVSCWHLYPDLLVFQREAKKIPFKDKLFPSAGILSLGLEYKGPSDNIAQWSLALSHLRYYGDPVKVQSREDLTRVRIDQLWLLVLGAIFRQWDVSYANFDLAVDWFRDLHVILSDRGDDGHGPQLSWIAKLCSAAAAALDRAADRSLIRYGWRRGRKILGVEEKAMHSPFFGLCNPHVMAALTKTTEVDCGIAYLRGIASELGLQVHEAVISYTGRLDHETTYTEWATIAPIDSVLGRCAGDTGNVDVSNVSVKRHVRWIYFHREGQRLIQPTILEHRLREIECAEEVCYITDEVLMPTKVRHANNSNRYQWKGPPPIFGKAELVNFSSLDSLRGDRDPAFRLYVLSEQYSSKMAAFFDQMRRAAATTAPLEQGRQCLRDSLPPQRVLQYLKESLRAKRQAVISSSNTRGLKRKGPMDEVTPEGGSPNSSLTQYRDPGGQSRVRDDITGAFSLMTGVCYRSKQWIVLLRALEVAHALYEQLPGATVSIRLIEEDLRQAKWLPPTMRRTLDNESSLDSFTEVAETQVNVFLKEMTRAASFACIIMFESGRFNVDPEQLNEVIALCSEDSIFVAGVLLTDPSIKKDDTCIRHLVGNIGQPGMALMVSPLEPRIRAVDHNPRLVEHRPYDGKYTDSFRETSLHLSFTTWKMPLDWHNTGEIDQEIFLLESVVAVQDNGKWVADIDVLDVEKHCPDVIEQFGCDENCKSGVMDKHDDLVSIDSWEELLDLPPCTGVLRAKGNWAARLAAAAVLSQQGINDGAVIVGDDKICWCCLRGIYDDPEPHMPQLIIF